MLFCFLMVVELAPCFTPSEQFERITEILLLATEMLKEQKALVLGPGLRNLKAEDFG